MELFQRIRAFFERDKASETGRASADLRGPVNDLGLDLRAESDGLRIKKHLSQLRTGDKLLVSYKLEGRDWVHMSVLFQDEPDGMFIYTDGRPMAAVVTRGDEVSRSRRDVKRSTCHSGGSDWNSHYWESDDLFDPFNPLSPFFGHSASSAWSPLNAMWHMYAPSGVERGETPPPEAPLYPATSEGENPFDVRGVKVPTSPAEQPTEGLRPGARSESDPATTGARDAVEERPDKELRDDTLEKPASNDSSPTPDGAGTLSDREPNAYC
jgi:hypothetical protein